MTMASGTEGSPPDGVVDRSPVSRFPSLKASPAAAGAAPAAARDGSGTGMGSRSSSLAYSSDRSSANSSPTKLPSIDYASQSNSVCSMKSLRSTRTEMVRSPSCPILWSDYDEDEPVPRRVPGDFSASIHSGMIPRQRGKEPLGLKLPGLFPNISCDAGRTGKTEKKLKGFTLRKSDPSIMLPFKPEKTFHRQISQPTALLLPMRETPRTCREEGKKAKNKKKAQPIVVPSSDSFGSSSVSFQSDSGISLGVKPLEDLQPSEAAGDVELDDQSKFHQGAKENYPDRSELISQEKCREWLEGVKGHGGKAIQNA